MRELPAYDEPRLRNEMQLFEDWYLNRHLDVQLDAQQKKNLNTLFDLLIASALEQPQVFVHRDYHSRNLMLTQHDNPGVIDYQDAVVGPCSYDLVSLLKDCYIEWPREKVEHWLHDYFLKSSVVQQYELPLPQFIQWFDFMGVQRHLKVLGIFARLNYRDGKAQYLNDLPLTLKYVLDACARYEELEPLHKLLEQTVLHHPMVAQA
jgi:aminoglycoside/choline kinase family phosphotransferase